MSGFEFREMQKLQQQMVLVESRFRAFLEDFLLRQALDVLTKVKENTPSDLSELRSAWNVGTVEVVGNGLVVTIYNAREEASFVEYGHYDPTHTNWIEGKFMCTLAIDEISRLIPQRFKTEFQTWIRGMGL